MGWPSAVLQLIWKKEAVENDAIAVRCGNREVCTLEHAYELSGAPPNDASKSCAWYQVFLLVVALLAI